MKNRIVTLLSLAACAGIVSAQSIEAGPGIPMDDDYNPFGQRATLWDNGDTDGVNGFSTWNDLDRYIYDDFVVSDNAGWRLNNFHTLHIWNSVAPGSGTGLVLEFYNDNAGSPGTFAASTNITSYAETATGRQWFGRDEARIDVTFDDVVLGAGTYWVAYSVMGPENGFSMVRSGITGSMAWWRADDLGVFSSSFDAFGAAADAAFSLTGDVVPAPASVALLGLGGLVATRRRR